MNGLTFDKDALNWFAKRFDPSLAVQDIWCPPDWPNGRDAVEHVFGLKRSSHFLRHHRGLLPQLWETQITKALRAMLLEAPDRTLERCQALHSALAGPRAPRLRDIDAVTADDTDRIDLAIHYRTQDNVPGCLAIEAKLGSELSPTQLPKYMDGLRKRYPRPEQRHLWVVAPTKTVRTVKTLSKRENAEWNFVSWRRLLLVWQEALPDEPSTDVLSLFSEIWKRVGGR